MMGFDVVIYAAVAAYVGGLVLGWRAGMPERRRGGRR